MNEVTTIKVDEETKSQLDQFREYKNESYNEVLKKLVFIAKNANKKPKLSKEAVEAIEKARKRMLEGKFLTEAEARKRLGIHVRN